MFGTGVKFKAKIKVGALIMHDHSFVFRWPKCNDRAPVKNPHIVFEAEDHGTFFELKAPGFGARKNYGNGGIMVSNFDDLVIEAADRKRILARRTASKQKELLAASKKMAEIAAELASIEDAPPQEPT